MKHSEIVCRYIRMSEYAIAWNGIPYDERPYYCCVIDNTHNPEFKCYNTTRTTDCNYGCCKRGEKYISSELVKE